MEFGAETADDAVSCEPARTAQNGPAARHFAKMAWSPYAQLGDGSAIPAACLKVPFLVSRF